MLPGKLCIGILEEDNPLKSYFRLKPLLIYNGERYEPFKDHEAYPSDGYLRIVPDKNESGRFKARMRRMGRYCLLDLRNHPAANDKIRTNKNYGINPAENNANIVYSDVIKEPIEGMILDIASSPKDELAGTKHVLIGDSNEVYHHVEEASGFSTYLAENGTIIPENELQRFELKGNNGRTLCFAVRISEDYIPVIPQETDPYKHPIADHPAIPASEPVPIVSTDSIPSVSIPENTSSLHETPNPLSAPANVLSPEKNDKAPSAIARERFPHVEALMNNQIGLNPRGRMSLMEIIDDKWCRSRSDQLGHPVPGGAMGQPLENPVDSAIRSIRAAWGNPETRRQLSDAIVEMRDVSIHLDQSLETAKGAELKQALEDLESERLMALAEIERLRREKAQLREVFKSEIRSEEASAFADAVAKTKSARDQLQALKEQISSTQSRADEVRDLLSSLNDGRFEKELQAFAIKNRCFEMFREMSSGDPSPSAIPEAMPTRDEWMTRAKAALKRRGLNATDVDAANLLICSALSDSIIISGGYGSDIRLTVDALAEALGASTADRYFRISCTPHHPLPRNIESALQQKSDIPGILLSKNISPEPAAASARKNASFISITELSDSGFPLTAERADTSWMLRLSPLSADAPWQISETIDPSLTATASITALRDAFLTHPAEIPTALGDRLQRVRNALAVHGVFLSRSILNDMLHYCGAMLASCRISAGETLDRAFAQRAMPYILVSAPVECLKSLPQILEQLPISAALLNEPLPIRI